MQSAHRTMCTLGAAIPLCGLWAHAATFVSTGTPTPSAGSETAFTTAGGAATVLAQAFTITEPVTVTSIEAFGVMHGEDLDMALYYPHSDRIWRHQRIATLFSIEPTTESQPHWHTLTLATPIELEAGAHDVSLGSSDPDGFDWHIVDASTGVNTGVRGRGVFPADTGGLLFFESDPAAPIFALRINGHMPSAGGMTLAALAGAGLLRRRR